MSFHQLHTLATDKDTQGDRKNSQMATEETTGVWTVSGLEAWPGLRSTHLTIVLSVGVPISQYNSLLNKIEARP